MNLHPAFTSSKRKVEEGRKLFPREGRGLRCGFCVFWANQNTESRQELAHARPKNVPQAQKKDRDDPRSLDFPSYFRAEETSSQRRLVGVYLYELSERKQEGGIRRETVRVAEDRSNSLSPVRSSCALPLALYLLFPPLDAIRAGPRSLYISGRGDFKVFRSAKAEREACSRCLSSRRRREMNAHQPFFTLARVLPP